MVLTSHYSCNPNYTIPICPLGPIPWAPWFPMHPSHTHPGYGYFVPCCQQPLPSPIFQSTYRHAPTIEPQSFLQKHEDSIRVIIQFDIPALLQKFPRLDQKLLQSHPYALELKKKYSEWFHEIEKYTGSFKPRFIYNLLVSGIAVTLPKPAVERLHTLPFIKAIYPDQSLQTSHHMTENTHTRQQQSTSKDTNLALINIPAVRTLTDSNGNPLDGRGIRVAVIDFGFNLSLLENKDLHIKEKYNFITDTTDIAGLESNHGTTMVQIIADVAPQVTFSLYVGDLDSQLIAAIEKCAGDGVHSINISLKPTGDLPLLIQAVKVAINQGVVIINSAGNFGENSVVDVPGAIREAISVGATDETGQKVADYSNYGVVRPTFEIKPDFVAPGVYVFHGFLQAGTSIAAPYVTGSVALIKQMHPSRNPSEIQSALATTATLIEERHPSAFLSQGSGRINVFKAIQVHTIVEPIHVSLQKDGIESISIKNQSDQEKTYTVHLKDDPRFRISFKPDVLTIPRGESRLLFIWPNTDLPYQALYGFLFFKADDQEWHVPIVLNREYTVQFSFNTHSPVNSALFSPTQPHIAVGLENHDVQIWDVSTKTIVYSASVPHRINQIAFSPDGKWLAIASNDPIIHVLDIETQTTIATFGTGDWVTSVAFDPTGTRLISGSNNNTITIWDVQSKNPQAELTIESGARVNCVAFSPDGKWIASGSNDNVVQVADAESGDLIATFNTVGWVNSISFNPEGTRIVSGSSNQLIHLWDLQTRNPVPLRIMNAGAYITSVSYSPDGTRIVSGSYNNLVQVWDARTGNPLLVFNAGEWVNSVAFSPDGNWIVSGSNNGMGQVWDGGSNLVPSHESNPQKRPREGEIELPPPKRQTTVEIPASFQPLAGNFAQ